jgi:hypothetical protein
MHVTEADRERVLRELRERYAADALTPEELDERVAAALAARSRRELADLVADGAAPATPRVARSADPTGRQVLEAQLAPGEWAEWVGGPDPSRHFNVGDFFLIPFGIFWLAFSLAWEAAVIVSGTPLFIVWGLPFVALGLYMVLGRYLYKARVRRRTVYAVTNRRVMTVVRRRTRTEVESKYLRALSSVSLKANSRASGTIEFDNHGATAPAWLADSGMGPFGRANGPVGLCFFDIEDAPAVAALVERLRASEA